MTQQQRKNKITELEQWLIDNPSHPNRVLIETDLRNLQLVQLGLVPRSDDIVYERDTFDIRHHNFHNV